MLFVNVNGRNKVAAVNPAAKVLVYMANQLHHGAMRPAGSADEAGYKCGLDNFRPEWRVTYDNGTVYRSKTGRAAQYLHNLSDPAAREWWLGVVMNNSLGPNVHGVFADNGLDAPPAFVSPTRARALLRGQQMLLDKVRAAGKWVIFNGLRYATTTKGRPLLQLKPYP